jgi:hypothetical protein
MAGVRRRDMPILREDEEHFYRVMHYTASAARGADNAGRRLKVGRFFLPVAQPPRRAGETSVWRGISPSFPATRSWLFPQVRANMNALFTFAWSE